VVLSHREFFHVRALGIPDFRDACGIRPNFRARAAQQMLAGVKIPIEDDADQRLLIHLQVNLPDVSVLFQQLRSTDIRFVNLPIFFVILQNIEGPGKGTIWDKGDADPVMDQASRDMDRPSIIRQRVKLLDEQVLLANLRIDFIAPFARQAVHEKEISVAEVVVHSCLRRMDVAIEGLDSFRAQFRGTCRGGRQAHNHPGNEKNGRGSRGSPHHWAPSLSLCKEYPRRSIVFKFTAW